MPGGGARGASTAAVRGSAGAGGISGCPAFGTAGCAPVTCVAGGFAGEGGAGDAAAGSGVFVPAAEDGSAAFGAGVDLQDKTASQRDGGLVRLDGPRAGGRYGAAIDNRWTCAAETEHPGVAVVAGNADHEPLAPDERVRLVDAPALQVPAPHDFDVRDDLVRGANVEIVGDGEPLVGHLVLQQGREARRHVVEVSVAGQLQWRLVAVGDAERERNVIWRTEFPRNAERSRASRHPQRG